MINDNSEGTNRVMKNLKPTYSVGPRGVISENSRILPPGIVNREGAPCNWKSSVAVATSPGTESTSLKPSHGQLETRNL